MAITSNLLPAISACGGWDGAPSSHIRTGFSPDKPLRCETNLPTDEPACRRLSSTAAKATPCCSPSMNTADKCYQAVCLIFLSVHKSEAEGDFGMHLHAEFTVYPMWIRVLSCAVCFSLKAVWLRLPLWIHRPSFKFALQKRLMAPG